MSALIQQRRRAERQNTHSRVPDGCLIGTLETKIPADVQVPVRARRWGGRIPFSFFVMPIEGMGGILKGDIMNQNPAALGNAALSLKEKQSMAKTGMIVSMGALVVTGFTPNRKSKVLHVGSGLALVGFAYWHYKLYEPKTGRSKQQP